MNHRAYYQSSINNFLKEKADTLLGILSQNHLNRSLEDLQRNTWKKQIEILQQQLVDVEGHIFFEFSIPRMGKRVDNIIIIGKTIFIVEFKIGSAKYETQDINQVLDYCLDLRNFHRSSHSADLVPVLVAEQASAQTVFDFKMARDFRTAISINASQLKRLVKSVSSSPILNAIDWANAPYHPTPTIVEAAQVLYQGHSVDEITRSDAGVQNLSLTNQCLHDIIEESKKAKHKAICFITGVPGAGKTLVGLNIATQRMKVDEAEHAVFLSGNGPLVNVLREALIRNAVNNTPKTIKREIAPNVESFIQNIHHFRDEYLKDQSAPIEKVVIFDEAQRAWDREQVSSFMKRKRGLDDFNQSEPQFLINVMNRHKGWCMIICLIGGGQEINTGESGLSEWIRTLKIHFSDWKIYYSPDLLTHSEYLNDLTLSEYLKHQGEEKTQLHLAISVRSFRSEQVSNFINALLELNKDLAKKLYQSIKNDYPIFLTRNLNTAKQWLKDQARGNERYGLLASSGSRRLKAFGIDCKNEINESDWFLNKKMMCVQAIF